MQDITEQIRESQDAADALAGQSQEQRRWKINAFDGDGNPVEREFIQEELGFFAKQEFMNLLTSEVDKFIRGEYGIKIGELFSGDLRTQLAPPDLSDPSQSAEKVNKTIEENIGLINAFIKLVKTVPELQKEIIALALGVKRGQQEREWFKWAIAEPPSRGGLTDEEGFEILKIFIRQNAKAIRSFFEDKATELVEEFRKEVLQESTTSEDSTEPSTEEAKETPLVEDAPTPGGTPSSTSSPATPVNV